LLLIYLNGKKKNTKKNTLKNFFFSHRIYVKHHFPNLTLTTINFFMTFFLLLFCLQAKLFTYIRLPILSMIPISACFGGFIAFSNLSLQYNTVGTYQLIKLQVTPGSFEIRKTF
jgi:solute carrier family 35 protein E3